MTSPLEETHISVKSYVLSFLITVFSFELVFNGIGTTDTYVRNRIKDRLPEYEVILD